jgi:tetraacyldisaccharide 4'-kinase
MSVFAKAPKFWFRENHPAARALAPLGFLYSLAFKIRFAITEPYRSKLPVICIGNFTMGGGGKTPLAIEVATLLREKGHLPVFLTRGYGGRTKGPHLVDHVTDTALDVGDEPLLLAQTAPVVVSANRVAGARFIEQMQADVILMDDGFQNPSLTKDLSLVVVDEVTGLGNGQVFPAGPLRASMALQLPKANALVISGPVPRGGQSASLELEQVFERNILRVEMVATGDVAWLRGARISAMTGIARPDKFYGSLERLGAVICRKHDFPDHHMFSEQDADNILRAARTDQTTIVMTQKDWVRLPHKGIRGRLRESARVLHVKMVISEPQKFSQLLENAISSASQYNA